MTSRPLYAVLLVLAAACGGGEARSDVIPRDRFVAANVALRLLPPEATEAQRRAALKKLNITDKQMLAWVDAHRADPRALADTWQDVAKRVDSLSALRPSAEKPPARVDGGDLPPNPGTAPSPAPPLPGEQVVVPPLAAPVVAGKPGRPAPVLRTGPPIVLTPAAPPRDSARESRTSPADSAEPAPSAPPAP